jgi:hypothetical protein
MDLGSLLSYLEIKTTKPYNTENIQLISNEQLVNHNFQQYFSCLVEVCFIGGEHRSTRRKPPTCYSVDKRNMLNTDTRTKGTKRI